MEDAGHGRRPASESVRLLSCSPEILVCGGRLEDMGGQLLQCPP